MSTPPSRPLRAGVRFLAGLAAAILAGCASEPAQVSPIRVTEVTLFGDLDCFRIETPSATYLYGKRGAGFAGILDPEGHDWISYRHGGKAAGEYRGLPKCGQPTKFFHCGYGYGQYTNDNPFTSRVVLSEPDHVRIASETKDGKSACLWDFHPGHATFTLEKMAIPRFWFLYEGTPAGGLDADRGFAIRPGGKMTPLSEPWEDEIPWACFGSPESSYGLFLVSRDAAVRRATYVAWPYAREADGSYRQMTVFGWGRLGWKDAHQHEPQLKDLPGRFSLALVRGTHAPALAGALEEINRPSK